MIFILLGTLIVSITGMAFIVLRHLPRAVIVGEEIAEDPEMAGASNLPMKILSRIDQRVRARVLPKIYRIVSGVFYFVERMGNWVTAGAHHLRRSFYIKSRRTPRETTYWKNITDWRGGSRTPDDKEASEK